MLKEMTGERRAKVFQMEVAVHRRTRKSNCLGQRATPLEPISAAAPQQGLASPVEEPVESLGVVRSIHRVPRECASQGIFQPHRSRWIIQQPLNF